MGLRLGFRITTTCMPEANDLNQVLRMIKSVNDPVRTNYDFTKEVVVKLGHNSAKFRELRQSLGLGNEKLTKLKSRIRRVERNETNDTAEVSPR